MVSEGDLPQPPYSVDLLSELHAGALPESVSARLWPRVREDREAIRVIEQLDAITGALHELGRDETVETPIPADVADRIGNALDSAPTESNIIAFPRRHRAWAITAAGVAVAAAAAMIVAAVVIPKANNDSGPGATDTMAQPELTSDSDPVLDFTDDPEPGRMMALVGSRDLGPLEDPKVLEECLQANDIDPSKPVLGSGQVRVRGEAGTVILLAGPRPPQITALVVGNSCGAGSPDTISRDDIG